MLHRQRRLCLAVYFGFLLLTPGLVGRAWADIYSWMDPSGGVHFTDNYAAVPPAYRDRIQIRPSAAPSETPFLPGSPSDWKRGARSQKFSRQLEHGGLVKVVAVIDGDTILIEGGEKVRYVGVNTPETKHPEKLPEYCGREAFEVNRHLVGGKIVRLAFDRRRRDRYGRLLAYVYVDDLFVNAELIRLGFAQVSMYRENQRYYREFLRLQREAIAERRGLWGGCQDVELPALPARKAASGQRGR